MPYIDALEIDDHILDKIESKHGVSWDEVEAACFHEFRHVRRGRLGLYKVFSRTEAGRFLLVVLAEAAGGVWRVVTARDMDQTEQRLYRRMIGGLAMADIDEEAARLEQHTAWEDTDEVVELGVRKPLDKVVPVRLPSDKWEALRRVARESGVGPTTLARMWLLEKLRQTPAPASSAGDRPTA